MSFNVVRGASRSQGTDLNFDVHETYQLLNGDMTR